MEKILTIAIPTYNRSNFLKASFLSLYEVFKESVEYIIYDSSENKDAYFSSLVLPNLLYIYSGKKLGIDKDYELMISYVKTEYTWVFSDDDTVSCRIPFLKKSILDSARLLGVDYILLNREICDIYQNNCKPNKSLFTDYKPGEYISIDSHGIQDYLRRSNEFSCLLTYTSSVIFRTKIYQENNPIMLTKIGYSHVTRFWKFNLSNGFNFIYFNECFVRNRSFNDSFLENGYRHRFFLESDLVNAINRDSKINLSAELNRLLKMERPGYQLFKVLSNYIVDFRIYLKNNGYIYWYYFSSVAVFYVKLLSLINLLRLKCKNYYR